MRVDSVKFLSVGLLLLISTLALNGAASKEAVIVKDVSFNHDGESLEVKITATDESKYTYFELNRPHRLVVDFHGIQNTIRFKEKKIEAAGVERVRTSFYSDKNRKATRIVFDLNNDANYRLIDDGGGNVRILFGSAAHAPLNEVAGPPVVPVITPRLELTEPAKDLVQIAALPALPVVGPVMLLPAAPP